MCCLKNKLTIRKRLALLPGMILIFSSCSHEVKTTKLFHIDSLLNAQVQVLADSKATLEKQATIGSASDHSAYTPADTTAWNRELEIFRQLRVINKPINRTNYIVDDGLFDPHSNLTVKAFSAIENMPVRYIRVFYQDSVQRPRKIEALYQDENPLSKSGRLLTMEFQQAGNKSILSSYSITGGQKIIFGDTVVFDIKGKIVFD
jgi:hypothetical protein